MSKPLLVVRKKVVEPRLRGRRFIGLPEDEANRWHPAFDVLSADRTQASEDPNIQRLVTLFELASLAW